MAMNSLSVLRLIAQKIIFFFSFGSIIVGAIRTKFAAKGGKSGETKKGSRSSFSFKGGMQVMLCQ